jgi:LEA14-like dessication related protein
VKRNAVTNRRSSPPNIPPGVASPPDPGAWHHGQRRALWLSLISAIGLNACGSLLPPSDLHPPSLAFEDLSIERIQFAQLQLKARIATHNPNSVDLPLTGVRFELFLYGASVAQGSVTESRLILPAHSDLTVPVTLTIPMTTLRRAVLRAARGESADAPLWEIQGRARWGMSPIEIPFAKHGDASTLEGLWQWMMR